MLVSRLRAAADGAAPRRIEPQAFLPAAFYSVVLSVTCTQGALAAVTQATFALQVASPPGGAGGGPAGGLSLDVRSGTGLVTTFTAAPRDWAAVVSEFSVTYMVVGDPTPAVLISDFVLLGPGAAAGSSVSMLLPAGLPRFGNLVTVQLWARSASGVQSLAPAEANVTVTWPDLSGAGAAAFVDGLAASAAALAASSPTKAQQLVAGLASFLNRLSVDPVANSAAVLAAQRLSLLSIMANTTGPQTTTSTVGAISHSAPAPLRSSAPLS